MRRKVRHHPAGGIGTEQKREGRDTDPRLMTELKAGTDIARNAGTSSLRKMKGAESAGHRGEGRRRWLDPRQVIGSAQNVGIYSMREITRAGSAGNGGPAQKHGFPWGETGSAVTV